MTHVNFAVEGLDDRGEPSGFFMEVVEVAIIDEDGAEVGRSRDPQDVMKMMWGKSFWKLKAMETIGEPSTMLTATLICDE